MTDLPPARTIPMMPNRLSKPVSFAPPPPPNSRFSLGFSAVSALSRKASPFRFTTVITTARIGVVKVAPGRGEACRERRHRTLYQRGDVMTDSTSPPRPRQAAARPPKPYEDFPLYPHPL